MSESTLLDELKSKDIMRRQKAAEKLGKIRTKNAIRTLLEVAQRDKEKDVRKAAIKSLQALGDPEAAPILKEISQKDSDRGVRREATKAVNVLQFSERDRLRAERDRRAFEKGEAAQPGLLCKIKEKVSFWISRDGKLIDEQGNPIKNITGTGSIKITNTGKQDRIWAIEANLRNIEKINFAPEPEGVSIHDSTLSLKELEASKTESVGYEFQLDKPKVHLVEKFADLENEELIPIFSRGTETAMRLKLNVQNAYPFKLVDVIIKKYFKEQKSSIGSFETDYGKIRESSDQKGRHVIWTIPEIRPNSEATASCILRVTLPEDVAEPYSVGNTILTYKTIDHTISGLGLITLTGSSSVFQYIRREEKEENPNNFVCQFELENTSEFEMDLSLVRIFDGSVEEGNVLVEWLGTNVSEEERSIDPGKVFTLDPWLITVEEDQIPQFGREIDLSVKYLFDAEVETQSWIPEYNLPFINIQATKAFAVETIPSYRRTPVETVATITSAGTTELQLLELEDFIPAGFEPPKKETIVITKDAFTLPIDKMKLETLPPPKEFKGQVLRITIPHLEETELGPLRQGEQITVKYQTMAISPKPKEVFTGNLIAYGNIYPEISPVKTIAEPKPIMVIHTRRKIKIGKMVRSTKAIGDINEYEVVLRGTNHGTAVLRNIIITDFIPKGFTIVGKTKEDPPVEHEEYESIENGRALKWVYKAVKPNQKVEIRYKLRAEGIYDPKEVYRMLLG